VTIVLGLIHSFFPSSCSVVSSVDRSVAWRLALGIYQRLNLEFAGQTFAREKIYLTADYITNQRPEPTTAIMHSLQAFLWIHAVLVTLILASPTPNLQKRSFTHVVKRSPPKNFASGPDAMRKAFRKFGFKNKPAGLSSNSTSGTASITAEQGSVAAAPEQNDAEYLSPVIIGNQTLTLDFDTGSSDLWVFSTKLTKKTIGQHAAFDPDQSSTFSLLPGATWMISYGDGSGAAGIVGTDTVNIGGATATRQAVELATALSSSFVQDTNNDGLVGLAFSSLNTVQPTPQTTFFDTIMSQLAQPLFSVDLKNDATGTYTFGAIDATAYTGTLKTVPIDNSNGFWQFASPSFQVGNTKVSNANGSPAIAGMFNSVST
jgi:Eukaryotic aspartyl protease